MSDERLRALERQAAQGDPSARARLTEEMRRVGKLPERPMLVLAELMLPRELAAAKFGNYPSHLPSLRACLPDSVEILCEHEDGDYQGEIFALLRVNDNTPPVYFLWRDSFGSCSGCDSLQAGEDPYDYVEATLAEGNTRQFWTAEEAAAYLRQPSEALDYSWRRCPLAGVIEAWLAGTAS